MVGGTRATRNDQDAHRRRPWNDARAREQRTLQRHVKTTGRRAETKRAETERALRGRVLEGKMLEAALRRPPCILRVIGLADHMIS